ncbi:MAG: hypothetical protein GAK45_01251 [Pseudomonas citronellolis]|nr:MAG: hypothetical protein GAK45_01251 [Pseudomonas citronellolis]
MSQPARTHRTPALAATFGVHALVLAGLYLGFQPQPPAAPQSPVLRTALVSLPSPPSVAPVAAPAEPVAPPPPAAVTPPPKPAPDNARLARQRLEQQRQREQEHQRQQQQRELAEQQERQQHEQQQQARAEAQRQASERAAAQAAAAQAAREALAAANYQPLVKKAPAYPEDALDRRLEGDCTVEYDVTPNGGVAAPHIVPGQCSHRLFERPSLQAAARFRYQPRVIEGQAVSVANVRNTFHYRLQEARR